jgi:hypothetical protein
MSEIGAKYSESGNSSEGINNLKFSEEYENIIDVIWELLEDKELIPSVCQLRKMVIDDYEVLSHLSNALNIHIKNSQPIITEEDIKELEERSLEELQEIDKQKNKKIDWVEIYVIIAREITYTIDQFYDLTQRQIFSILKRISKIKHDEELKRLREFKLIASLLGARLKIKTEIKGKPKSSFDKNTDDFLMEKVKQRIKKRVNDGR